MSSDKTITSARSAKAARIFRAGILSAISLIVVQQALARIEIILPKAEPQNQAATAGSWRTLKGVIQTYWFDYPDHAKRVDHLVTPEGTVELQYTRQPRHSFSGKTVSITGRLDGNYLALDPSDVESTATSTAEANSPPLTNVFGAQRMLVIPVKFQTDPSEPWTLNEISQSVIAEPDAWFRDISFDRTWFEGEVIPWVTVDRDPTICEPTEVRADANTEAGKLGYDTTGYDRLVYVVPAINCPWSGIGGGGLAMVKTLTFRTIVHELGHSFGLKHAHSAVCLAGESWSWTDGCTNYMYGDPFDVMGASTAPFNVYHQRRLGYLDTDPGSETTLVDISGDYQIGSYAAAGSLSRALRIPAGMDPASGMARTLYVTRREPVGRDAVLGNNLSADQNRIHNGIVIHIGVEDTGHAALIDMTPQTRTGISDMNDAPLLVGEAYIDPLSGIMVAPVTVEPGAATIAVALGPTDEPVPEPTDNRPPQAVDDVAEGVAGKSVEVPVLSNDFDPDYDPLAITYLTVPLFGSVLLNSNGVPVYRAPRKFQGIDTFSYEISDGVARATAVVTVTVSAGAKGGGGTKGGGRKK